MPAISLTFRVMARRCAAAIFGCFFICPSTSSVIYAYLQNVQNTNGNSGALMNGGILIATCDAISVLASLACFLTHNDLLGPRKLSG